jgi:hypothetical protein
VSATPRTYYRLTGGRLEVLTLWAGRSVGKTAALPPPARYTPFANAREDRRWPAKPR